MRTSKVTLEWGDGEYDFKLGIGELEELEVATRRVRNADGEYVYMGPIAMHESLRDGTCLVRDVREVLRIGLIGGGTKPADARNLVKRYFDEVPDFLVNRQIAALIVGAVLAGYDIEPLGKAEEERGTKETPSTTGDFPSPHSTLMRQ
jgi:hypothetical protein